MSQLYNPVKFISMCHVIMGKRGFIVICIEQHNVTLLYGLSYVKMAYFKGFGKQIN